MTTVKSPESLTNSTEVWMAPPSFADEMTCLYPYAIDYFDPDVYHANHQLLTILKDNIRSCPEVPSHYPFFREVYPALELPPAQVCRLFTELQHSGDFQDTMAEELGIDIRTTREVASLDEYRALAVEKLSTIEGMAAVVSGSHVIDLPVLLAAEDLGIPLEQVAVFIVDRHFDAGTPQWTSWHPVKSNVVNYLLDAGIGAVLVAGMMRKDRLLYEEGKYLQADGEIMDVAEVSREMLRSSGSQDLLYQVTHMSMQVRDDVVLPHLNRLAFLREEAYFDGRRNRTRDLSNEVRAMFEEKLPEGIRFVFLSADMDSLALFPDYSATEYNPYAALLAPGVQDLSPILSRHQFSSIRAVRELLSQIESSRKKRRRLKKVRKRGGIPGDMRGAFQKAGHAARYHKAVDLIDHHRIFELGTDVVNTLELAEHVRGELLSRVADGTVYPRVTGTPIGGFTEWDQQIIIKEIRSFCERHSVTFGLPFSRGVLRAHFSECFGPDLRGNTARTVRKLISTVTE